MPRLHIVYDPTDTCVLPMPDQREGLHFRGVRFAAMDIAGGLPRERIVHIAERLAHLLLEQIPQPEQRSGGYRIRVPHEQEATPLPLYAVYDFGLTMWSLTTRPDLATRWASMAGAENDKDHAPQRIKRFGYVEEIAT